MPEVADEWRVIMQGSPQMTSQDAFDRIARTAKDLGEDGKDPKFGHGLLNVYRAVGGDQVTVGQANQKDPAN